MKKLLAVAAACLLLSGCGTDEETARRALDDAGYTDVKITGYSAFSCGESDTFSTGFEATNIRGKRIKGTVCSDWMKGATIRL